MARVRSVISARGLGLGQEAVVGRQRDGPDALHVEPHFMIEIPRRWEENFIPFAADRGQCCGEGLVAAGGDRDAFCRDFGVVMRAPAFRQRGAQFRQAQNRPVKMGLGHFHGLGHGATEGRRRRIHGGGLAHVDQRPVGREVDAFDPAFRLRYRRGEGGLGTAEMGHLVFPVCVAAAR
jgi:hypothetical protein